MTEGGTLASLVWRDVLTAVRTPAVWAVMAVQIALMALYLLVWGDGVPLVGARPVLAQFATTQWVFLSLALPWATHGCDINFSGPCGQLSTYAIERFIAAVTQ